MPFSQAQGSPQLQQAVLAKQDAEARAQAAEAQIAQMRAQAAEAQLVVAKYTPAAAVVPVAAAHVEPPPKGTQPSALLQATDMEMRSSVDALLSQWAAEGQVAAAGAWS